MTRIALLMLVGDPPKYLGLIFGVMFAALLMTQQMAIFVNLMRRTASVIYDVQEAQIWVMDPRVRYLEEVEPLADTAVQRVRGVEGVAWAAPLMKGSGVIRTPGGVLQQVVLLGIDDATLTGGPRQMLAGSLESLGMEDAVIMDRAGYAYIWPGEPLEIGRRVEINDREAVLVGICEASPPFNTFPILYTRYSLARAFSPPTRNQLSFVLARAEEGECVDGLAERIGQRTGLAAVTSGQFAWQTIEHYLTRTGIPINFGITVLLGFLVGAAIVGQTLYLFVVENIRQLAALKAMGVTGSRLAGMVLLQGAVVGGIGYGLGFGAAALFFELTGRTSEAFRGFFLPWEVGVIAGVAIGLIILLATLASMRRVLRVDPALVFRG